MIEQKSLKSATFLKGFQRHRLLAGLALLSASSVLLLSGCSSAYKLGGSPTGATEVSGLSGIAHGGQFPVTGATISLYEIGATSTTAAGYAAALPAPLATTTTDSNGNWGFSSFTCANSSDELYLVATGGNPGLGSGVNNAALIMTTVAGPCGNLFGTSFDIDEITTVATEYALAPFSTTYQNVGTSTTNARGLANAFATVPNLVNLSANSVTQGSFGAVAAGNAWLVAPAYVSQPANTSADLFEGIVPYDTINTLANVLASCVNTTSGSSSACTSLFNITGGSLSFPIGDNGVTGPVATNTADAALFIAHNPGLPAASGFQNNNLGNLYALINSSAPFTPFLSAAPASDFTLALNFTSGGLGGIRTTTDTESEFLAIDQAGNVWIPNKLHGGLFELSNVGTPLSPTTTATLSGTFAPVALGGYQNASLVKPEQAAVDQNGNIWLGDGTNCLFEYIPGTGFNASAPFTSVCGGHGAAIGTSVDSNNQIWVAGTGYISAATSSGALASGSFPVTTGFSSLAGFLGPDYSGNTWYIDGGDGEFGELNGSGVLQGTSTANKFNAPSAYSAFGIDSGSGGCNTSCLSFFVMEPGGSAIQPINTNSFTTIPGSFAPATMISPGGVAVDGNGRIYVAAQGSAEVPSNVTVLLSNGTSVSPDGTGFQGATAFTALDEPTGISVDQSGNVWVVNTSNAELGYGTYFGNGSNSANVTEFVGLAAPVNPVYSLDAKNQTYAKKP